MKLRKLGVLGLTGKGNLEQQWIIEWLMGLSNRLLVELLARGVWSG